jgi:hypothetical protein
MLIGDGLPVLVSYQIVNHGDGAGAAQQAEIDLKIASSIASALATIGGIVFAPAGVIAGAIASAFAAAGSAISWIFGGINCDGMVLNDNLTFSGGGLADLVGGEGLYRQTKHYHGPDTASGCGSNAEYDVTWSVTSKPVPSIDIAGQLVDVVIINKNSGLCLDVPSSQQSNGIRIQQYPINNEPNQRWRLARVTPGTASTSGVYTITSVNTIGAGLVPKCLDIPGASTASQTLVQQFQANGGRNQEWRIAPAGDGSYYIINVNSGLYLDVPNASFAANVNIQQYPYNGGGDNQKWILAAVPFRL